MTSDEAEPPAALEPAGARPAIGLVSVIVPHLDDYDNLDACLTLLEAQSFPRDRMEIIVADNGSSRGVGAVQCIVGSRGRVIEVAERGAGPARNAGVRASRGEAIAFIDSDCRPDKRWLEEGLAELRLADFAGGRVDVLVQDPQRMTAAEAFESVFAFQNERYAKDLNFTVSASMFVWRSVFDAVGGFENGVPEDKDWCMRAGRQGYRIRFAPKSIVGHPARRTMPELKRKWRRLTLESCEGARRDGRGPALVLLRQCAALLAVAPHAVAPLTSARLSGIRNRLMAVGALTQIRAYRFSVACRAVMGGDEKRRPSPPLSSGSRAPGPSD
jgi:cellulose synthase/poly-beta-1,6-N-acetylglucosamine synthase-like glycosyltransferase